MTTFYDARIDWRFIRGQEGDWSIGYVPNVKNKRGLVKSGTTVLFGFDLGQHDLTELKDLKLSPGLQTKLASFMGAKGPDAVMAEERKFEKALDTLITINNAQTGSQTQSVGAMHPAGVVNRPTAWAKPGQTARQFVAPETTVFRLELTPGERTELTHAIQKHFYRKLQVQYDGSRRGRKFSALPIGAQTGLLSLSWQTGNIWSHKHRAYEVFRAALKEDWLDVIDSLRAGKIAVNASKADRHRRYAEAELIRVATGTAKVVGPKEKLHPASGKLHGRSRDM